MTDLWIALVVGVLIGIWIGRRWAEWGRASYDSRKAWRGRDEYRRDR